MTRTESKQARAKLWAVFSDRIRDDSENLWYSKHEMLNALDTYTAELDNDAHNDCLDLHDLPRLKAGIRSATAIMAELQSNVSEQLEEWTWGKNPVNEPELIYGCCQQILLDLSMIVSSIEYEYPDMKAEFDAERQAYFESTRH
jgi:hypothetical protein